MTHFFCPLADEWEEVEGEGDSDGDILHLLLCPLALCWLCILVPLPADGGTGGTAGLTRTVMGVSTTGVMGEVLVPCAS